jgi:hypothetical protein
MHIATWLVRLLLLLNKAFLEEYDYETPRFLPIRIIIGYQNKVQLNPLKRFTFGSVERCRVNKHNWPFMSAFNRLW